MEIEKPMYYSPLLFFKLMAHTLSPNPQVRRAAMIALTKVAKDYLGSYTCITSATNIRFEIK